MFVLSLFNLRLDVILETSTKKLCGEYRSTHRTISVVNLALYDCTRCGVDVLNVASWLCIRDQLITLSNHEPGA